MAFGVEWASGERRRDIAEQLDPFIELAVPVEAMKACQEFFRPYAEEYSIELRIGISGKFIHWSRNFEYGWAMANARLRRSDSVLDAGGGDSLLKYRAAQLADRVDVLDIDSRDFTRLRRKLLHLRFGGNVGLLQGDLREIPSKDDIYDRVLCVSVLEHIERPVEAVREMRRVLKPGGRLVLTFDVADYVRYNHTINVSVAGMILAELGMPTMLPPKPEGTLSMGFPELSRRDGEPEMVSLSVLCVYWDKP